MWIWAVVAAWDTLGSQLMPPGLREKWPTTYDVVAKTTGYFPFWVWILVGAAMLMAFVLEYAHRKQGGRGGDTFYSPTVTQHPPTPAQLRALPTAPLRQARKEGVALRNRVLASDEQFAEWMERYHAWRERTLSAAAKASPVLHDLLDTLNEMQGYPAGVIPFNDEHARRLAIVSEILRRIDRYLAAQQ
jgi:hypothetical protein